PRFIAEYDNLLLAHADRGRVLSEQMRKQVLTTPNAIVPGTVLLDGFVRGRWRMERERGAATLDVELHGRIPRTDLAALDSAGADLLRFAAPGEIHRTRFTAPA
ncbi:winged helix DNA-binding domain-containing protein, partial [Amycolatopsis rhizosphaerae]